jgi:CRISPR-associated protein Csd1
MILQELVRYYERKGADPDPAQRLPSAGLEDKDIPFVVELSPDGTVVQLRDTRQRDGKRLRAQSFLVPCGEKKTSGVRANLLWDTAAYAIGLARERKSKSEVTPAAAFLARVEALPDEVQQKPGIRAVLAALRQSDWSALERSPAWPEVVETNPVMSFALAGDSQLVCQDAAVVAALAVPKADETPPHAMCLVDGTEQPVQRLHTAIKGVWGAQTSGANIVSFNARSFESYGKTERQGENAPIGERAAFAYTTALNHLLGKDSRNRVQVGDASAVFWADGSAPLLDGEFSLADFLGEPRDQPDRGVLAVQALYRALASGQLPVGERGVRFFVLGLAPNAARISVRFWITATVAELAPRIRQHFDDLRVVRHYDNDPPVPSLFRLLTGLALQGKVDNVPPRLAGEWMRAILEGLPYPALLLNAAVIRCKAEREVSYLRAAILKAWLNRDTRRRQPLLPADHAEFKEELDMDQADAAYRLGRVFAVLERIQQRAQPGINATIRDRYYGAASTTPVSVFTTLLRLKNAHLKKLGEGESHYFERLLGSIFGTLEAPALADFPRQLNLPDQGRFALGYYHQRQSFYAGKKPDAEAKADEANDTPKED